MRFWTGLRLVSLALASVSVGLAACSGNLGSGGVGGGLPIAPGAQGYQQPQGPGQSGPTSRQRVVEGAVYMTSELASIPLPPVNGFELSLDLASPSPGPSSAASASASGSASPSSSPGRNALQHTSRVVVVAQNVVSSPVASPSVAPSAAGSPVPSGSPGPPAAGSASPKASPKPAGSGKPGASPSPAGSKIETKLVAYPDYAPEAPTPAPTGNVQVFTKRKAIVTGYVSPSVDLALYGLAAARFTVPKEELTPGRGFTVAIFSSAKKHKAQLIASDTSAALSNGIISSSLTTPLTLKKGSGYDIVLYGDELASTPPPVPPNYATPGNNPFVTPTPPGYAPQPGQNYPGQPYPGQTATPYPGQTYPPSYATPTPYPGH